MTNEDFTHVIVTYAKSRHFITAAQEIALSSMSNEDKIRIEGNTVLVKSIAEIMTIEKFYATYPDERPETMSVYKTFYGGTREGYVPLMGKVLHEPAREQIKRGFIGFFIRERGLSESEAGKRWNDFIGKKYRIVRSIPEV